MNSRPSSAMSGNQGKIHINNIPLDYTEPQLRELFSQVGPVGHVNLVMPQGVARPRAQFASVQYRTPQEATRAIELLHQKPPLNLAVSIHVPMLKNRQEQSKRVGGGAAAAAPNGGHGENGNNNNRSREDHNQRSQRAGGNDYPHNSWHQASMPGAHGGASSSGGDGPHLAGGVYGGEGWEIRTPNSKDVRPLLRSNPLAVDKDDRLEEPLTKDFRSKDNLERFLITAPTSDNSRSVVHLDQIRAVGATSLSISDRIRHQGDPILNDASIVEVGGSVPLIQSDLAMPALEALNNLCATCQRKGNWNCPICKTPYCSGNCQKKDWPKHKFICHNKATAVIHGIQTLIAAFNVIPVPTFSPTINSRKALLPTPLLPPITSGSTNCSAEKTLTSPIKDNSKHNSSLPKTSPSGNQSLLNGPNGSNSPTGKDRQASASAESNKRDTRTNGQKVSEPLSNEAKGPVQPPSGAQSLLKGPNGSSSPTGKDRLTSASAQSNRHDKLTNGQKVSEPLSNEAKGPVQPSPPITHPNSIVLPVAKRSIAAAIPLPVSKCRASGIVLTEPRLSSDKATKVSVVHVNNPSDFFVHVSEGLDEFHKMMKIINENESLMNTPSAVIKGDLLCTKFSDNWWYRVEVKEINGDAVVVKYMDYGNEATVSRKDLRSLCPNFPPIFINSPRQAISCALHDVEPLDGSWSAEDIKLFNTFTKKCDSRLHANLIQRTIDGKALVTITRDPENGLSVSKVMCDRMHAKYSLRIQSSCISSWMPGKDILLSFQSNESSDSIWVKCGNLSSKEAQELFVDFSTYYMELPLDNDWIAKVNDLVAAKNSEDGNWYRAKLMGHKGHDWIVRFLDLGNVELVSVIRPLDDRFRRMASLAVLLKFEPGQVEELLANDPTQSGQFYASVELPNNSSDTADVIVRPDLSTTSTDGVLFLARASSVWLASNDEAAIARFGATIAPVRPSLLPPRCELVDPKGEAVVVDPVCLDSLSSLHVQVMSLSNCINLNEISTGLLGARMDDPQLDMGNMPPAVGQLVCAKYLEDGMWYRASVLEAEPGAPLLVRFIDYGNKDHTDQVRLVPTQFRDFPRVSREVVPHITLPNVTVSALQQLLNDHRAQKWYATLLGEDGDVPTVVLRTGDGDSLDDLLVQRVALPPVGFIPQVDAAVPTALSPADLSPPADAAVPKALSSLDVCLPVNAAVAEEAAIEMNSAEVDDEVFTLFNSKYDKFDVGQKLDVVVIDNSSIEWVMVRRPNEAAALALERLTNDMTQYCEAQPAIDYVPDPFIICIAKSTELLKWGRAMVMNHDDEHVQVMFVDSGTADNQVLLTNIRTISRRFMDLPFQAVQCSIVGMNVIENPSKLKEFQQLVPLNSVLSIEVVNNTSDGIQYIRIPSIEDALKRLGT